MNKDSQGNDGNATVIEVNPTATDNSANINDGTSEVTPTTSNSIAIESHAKDNDGKSEVAPTATDNFLIDSHAKFNFCTTKAEVAPTASENIAIDYNAKVNDSESEVAPSTTTSHSVAPPESPSNDPAIVRTKTMEMKNRRQEENAIKAMKLCGAVAVADGVAVGAVVSLKVDYRTHSHANGLLGVVYAVKEGTGGILVCCDHGVITHSGTKGDYWVPYDKYRVVAKKEEVIPLPDAIEQVRNMVLAGKYDANTQNRISYAKLHDILIQSSSPVKKGKGCTCRKGCKKSCGCKKRGSNVTVDVSAMAIAMVTSKFK